jgi:hypothetical protein
VCLLPNFTLVFLFSNLKKKNFQQSVGYHVVYTNGFDDLRRLLLVRRCAIFGDEYHTICRPGKISYLLGLLKKAAVRSAAGLTSDQKGNSLSVKFRFHMPSSSVPLPIRTIIICLSFFSRCRKIYKKGPRSVF